MKNNIFNWNPVFKFCMDIKHKYLEKFKNMDYKERHINDKTVSCLEFWANEIKNDFPEFTEKLKYLKINQKKNCVLIRYVDYPQIDAVDFNDFWDLHDGFYQECRSIVIDLKNEEIVIAPFKKFRNMNECEENSLDNIRREIETAKSIEVTNKLDGSMQCLRCYHNEIFFTGSSAIDSSKSWRLVAGMQMLTTNYLNMARNNPNLTFIFEFIHLEDAHVVKYQKEDEGLYLIGIRNVTTGEQLSYSSVEKFSKTYDVPMTRIFDKCFEEVLSDIKILKSDKMEGFVLNIDGHMVKVKCDDYVSVNKILSKISSVNLVIKNIADGTIDDLHSKIPKAYMQRVQDIESIVFNYMKKMEIEVNRWYELAPKDNIKQFMYWVDTVVPKTHKHYVRNKYLGIKNNYLKSGNNKSPRYKKIKEMGVDDCHSIFTDKDEGL